METTQSTTSVIPTAAEKQPTLTLTTPTHTDGARATFGNLVSPHLKGYSPASNLAFNEKVRKLIQKGEAVYHFAFGQAPFAVCDGMMEALAEHAGENAYLPVAGIPELRETLCRFHKRYDNLDDLDPEQVIVGPGSKELIYLLMNVFHGDILLVSPSWVTYKPQCQLSHHQCHIVNTTMEDEWRVTAKAIEQTIKDNSLTGNKMLVLVNPDNPTGTSYRASHLKELSEVCRKNNIIVLSDEIYGRLTYDQNHDTLARYYPEGTIISTGFSKWASAGGWRIGYHIYPRELNQLKESVESSASHTFSCAPAPMQYAVEKALKNEDAVDDYIRHTSRILATVAAYCHRELTSAGVKCVKSAGGYYIFPNFEILRGSLKARGITTGTQMCEAMFDEARIALMAGGPSFLRPVEEFTTRLCYVNFDGTSGLAESRRVGLDASLDDVFLRQHCRATYDGIQALKQWVLKQLKEHK